MRFPCRLLESFCCYCYSCSYSDWLLELAGRGSVPLSMNSYALEVCSIVEGSRGISLIWKLLLCLFSRRLGAAYIALMSWLVKGEQLDWKFESSGFWANSNFLPCFT